MTQYFYSAFASISKDRKEVLFLCAVAVVSLVLHLILFDLEPTLSRDAITYLDIVQQWSSTGKYPFSEKVTPPPLYLWMIKTLSNTGLSPATAGLLINSILGAALPPLCFFLCLEIIHKKDVSMIAACLAAVHPVIADFTKDVLREISYLFFLLLFLIATFRLFRQNSNQEIKTKLSFRDCITASLAGLFLACSFLSRVEAIEYIFFVILLCGYHFFHEKSKCFLVVQKGGMVILSSIIGVLLLLLIMGIRSDEWINSLLLYYKRLT